MCVLSSILYLFFFFKQKTAYEMRISDWSSDVCSSDLCLTQSNLSTYRTANNLRQNFSQLHRTTGSLLLSIMTCRAASRWRCLTLVRSCFILPAKADFSIRVTTPKAQRSEEHTSELQSLMRSSYAFSCLKKKKRYSDHTTPITILPY